MGNQKKARFTFYDAPGSGKRQKHEHIHYSTTSDGRMKVSTSFIAPDLQLSMHSQHDGIQSESFDPDASLDETNYEPLDPAYLEHLHH
jgi:hypothetical protein